MRPIRSGMEESLVRSRKGFTLIETLMVVVVIGLAGLIAFPKFSEALGASNMRSARVKVTSLYANARAAAASSGRTAYLHLAGGQVYVTATPRRKLPIGANTQDTLTSPTSVYTQYGVSVTADKDSIRIDPAGIGRDSVLIRLTKGVRVDTVRISQYGRVLQ